MNPAGLLEELALERHAALELRRQADELWAARRYRDALEARAEAEAAGAHVARLELSRTDC